jgi:beta-lactamase regulating signal transducer with metallopeptidase domain
MNALFEIAGQFPIRQLGWTLVHFVWEGLVIAALFAGLEAALRKRSANARYVAGCCALACLLLAPAITFGLLPRTDSPAQPVPAETAANQGAISTITERANATRATQTVMAIPVRAEFAGLADALQGPLEATLPWLVAFWSLGVALLTARLLFGSLQVMRLKRSGHEPLGGPCLRRFQQLQQALAISRPVRLVQSALVEVPTVIGWLRPMVLLPASTLTGLAPEQLEAILAHELAHIRRHDYLVNVLQKIVETLLFYHPAVWWISRRVRVEREHCCDDTAVNVCGNPLLYARALAALEELRSAPVSLALAANDGPLLGRIRRLLAPTRPALEHRTDGALLIISGTLLVLFLCLRVAAWETPGPSPAPPPNPAPDQAPTTVKTNESLLRPATVRSAATRLAILQKLTHLVLDTAALKDTPLSQVAKDLSAQAKALDPEKKGINILLIDTINHPGDSSPAAEAPGAPPLIGDFKITLDPPLKQATLGQVLDAIVKNNPPLAYRVEDYAVAFFYRDTNPPLLYTRWFRASTNELAAKLHLPATLPMDDPKWTEQLRSYLESQGIPLPPPRQVFYDQRTSKFLVRASLEDLARVELALSPPPTIQVDIKVVEIAARDRQAVNPNLWLDAGMKDDAAAPFKTLAPTNFPGSLPNGLFLSHGRGDGTLVTNQIPATNYAVVSGLLTDAQYQQLTNALATRPGVDVLSTPRVVVKNEQWAKIYVGSVQPVSIGLTAPTNAGAPASAPSQRPEFQPILQQFNTGITIDLTPVVSSNRQSIRLTIAGAVNEFLDYAAPAQGDVLTAVVDGKKITAKKPLPQFRLRQAADVIPVPLGHTAVLGLGPVAVEKNGKDKVPLLGDVPLLGRLFRKESKWTERKDLWFFATPRLVDAAGPPAN